jgi:hypothetical protein
MNRRAIPIAACLLSIGAIPIALAWQDDSVAVAAGADRDYVAQKFGALKGARPETFVFAQGRFFGGYLRDSTLEHTDFLKIARTLTPSLAKQKYFPSADAGNADLLLVVHWGITSVEEDPGHGQTELDQLQKDGAAYNAKFSSGTGGASKGGVADPGYVGSDLAIAFGQSSQAGSALADNARLLGYDSELRKEEYRSIGTASGMTELDRRLREEIADERYFVILMAYDYKSVKAGKKGVKAKLLWSTHFSVRALGFNFAQALPAMSMVASNYFGHQVDGLLLDARKMPDGRVDVGVPETVEEKRKN